MTLIHENETYYTVEEAANALPVTIPTLYSVLETHRIPTHYLPGQPPDQIFLKQSDIDPLKEQVGMSTVEILFPRS